MLGMSGYTRRQCAVFMATILVLPVVLILLYLTVLWLLLPFLCSMPSLLSSSLRLPLSSRQTTLFFCFFSSLDHFRREIRFARELRPHCETSAGSEQEQRRYRMDQENHQSKCSKMMFIYFH